MLQRMFFDRLTEFFGTCIAGCAWPVMGNDRRRASNGRLLDLNMLSGIYPSYSPVVSLSV